MTAHSRRDDARARLDALIDHQAIHDPDNTRPIRVSLSPTALGRLLGKPVNGNQFEYRGRTVQATASDPVAARFLGGTL